MSGSAPAWRRSRLRAGVLVLAALAMLTGCVAGHDPAPTPSAPALPAAMSASDARALDVCALLPEDELARVLPADGSVPAHRDLTRRISDCTV